MAVEFASIPSTNDGRTVINYTERDTVYAPERENIYIRPMRECWACGEMEPVQTACAKSANEWNKGLDK